MNDKILQERAKRVEDAFRLLQGNKDGLGNIPGILRQLISLKVWEGYDWKGRTVTFSTFREFVETSPPEGLGTTVEELVNFCKKYPEIADLVDQTVQEQKPDYQPPKGMDITNKRKSGTSYQRSLRRLRALAQNDTKARKLRDQVLRGEISPSRALVNLGQQKRRYALEATPDAIIEFVKKHLSASQIKKLMEGLR